MNKPNRKAWNDRIGHDTLLNGALIAAGMVGLLLALLDAPAPSAAQVAKAECPSNITAGGELLA